MHDPLFLFYSLIILLFSAVIHEVAHGIAAYYMGDNTARDLGRITLNPLKHIELFGTILLPIMTAFASGGSFVFGWAKPVPYNPNNLRNKKWGEFLVAISGILANLLIAIIACFFVRYFNYLPLTLSAWEIIMYIGIINITLALFNAMPIPPLDGSKILFSLLPYRMRGFANFIENYALILFVIFVVFGWKYISPLVYLIFKFLVGNL